MPSKHSYEVETCWPCKWLSRHLYKSGLHPIWESRCTYVTGLPEDSFLREKGRFIGENTDVRPSWCPIRGNADAEDEARGDVELDDNEDKSW